MHILVTNDDGPPSNQSSPYIHSLISTLQAAGHTVSVCLPHTQRSWIGKAHMVGQTLTPSYFRPGTILKDDGIVSERPFNDGQDEWVLVDGTPASCAQIGLHHLFRERGPVDLLVSGPNYGRNTTAVFALSSGTIGGAMEGAVNGVKSIALSYAFDSREHDAAVIAAASQVATKLIEKFYREWPEDVHLYSINVPLRKGVESTKILYTEMLQNTWTSGSSFTELPEDAEDQDPKKEEQRIRRRSDANESPEKVPKPYGTRSHVTFKWSPQFTDIKKAVEAAGKGDGWEVVQGHVTVTPLRANFWHLPHYTGEIKLHETMDPLLLRSAASEPRSTLYAVVDYPDAYVQPLILKALKSCLSMPCQFVTSIDMLPASTVPVLQYTAYEALNFEHAASNLKSSLICAYVIRKALIRKHYLSNTIATWLVKNPQSILATHFKPCTHFELDFAEFLDEALVDAWDLNESLKKNEERDENGEDISTREWWILKPGMSDGGNGIRLFSTAEELQSIFEDWEGSSGDGTEEEEDSTSETDDKAGELNVATLESHEAMTSQLRHFIAQPYIDPPLLLTSYGNRKFHLRVYVVAAGAVKVFVYREMLALFAAKAYIPPGKDEQGLSADLARHLTNTCYQDESSRQDSVHRFWSMHAPEMEDDWQERLFTQICSITGEVFEAAAREQMVHFQTIPNAFEVFGVDFLVDANQVVWLLELNAYPDFKQTGVILQDEVVGGLFEEITKVVIEPFFGGDTTCAQGSDRLRLVMNIDLGRR